MLDWLNIVAPGAILYASWRHATRSGLVEARAASVMDRLVKRRIIAQGLYAFGAALCLFSTYRVHHAVQVIYVVGLKTGTLLLVVDIQDDREQALRRLLPLRFQSG